MAGRRPGDAAAPRRQPVQQGAASVRARRGSRQGSRLLRFRGREGESLRRALERLRLPAVCQSRVFVTPEAELEECAVVIEAPATALIHAWRADELTDWLGPAAEGLLGVWRYTRYVRTNL